MDDGWKASLERFLCSPTWNQAVLLVLGVLAGMFLSPVLQDMLERDPYRFSVIVAVIFLVAYLLYCAGLFWASNRRYEESNDRLQAVVDRMQEGSLRVRRHTELLIITEEDLCEVRTVLELYNGTRHICSGFRFRTGVTNDRRLHPEGGRVQEGFEVRIGGEHMKDITPENVEHSLFETTYPNDPDRVEHGIDILVPLNLRPDRTCTVDFRHRDMEATFSESGGGHGCFVHYPTDRLVMEAVLDRGLADRYDLCLGNSDGTGPFHVCDFSGNVMYDYEQRLESRDPPAAKGNSVRWTVDYPYVDCNYKLFFRLVPKQRL